MARHLILIHGRSTKPPEADKKKFVKRALDGGLDRLGPGKREAFWGSVDKFSFVYYGDVLNQIMVENDQTLCERMVKSADGLYYEDPARYEQDLETLLERPTQSLNAETYRAIVRAHADWSWHDDLARIASALGSPFSLNEWLVRQLFPDLSAYFSSRVIGSKIRQRLQKVLIPAMRGQHSIALVCHSMGSMVAYDVLWKFSRMSEYEFLRESKVDEWITVGSPLGEPGVRRNLYDSNEPKDGVFPNNIRHWYNIAAHDDVVAHDPSLLDDFDEMRLRGYVESIQDARIYNLWVGQNESNPHKFYGYLNHPVLAARLARWAGV